MIPNVGKIDRAIRLLLGLVLIAAPLVNFPVIWGNPVWAYSTMAVGLLLALTATLRFCPLYRLLGVSTCSLP